MKLSRGAIYALTAATTKPYIPQTDAKPLEKLNKPLPITLPPVNADVYEKVDKPLPQTLPPVNVDNNERVGGPLPPTPIPVEGKVIRGPMPPTLLPPKDEAVNGILPPVIATGEASQALLAGEKPTTKGAGNSLVYYAYDPLPPVRMYDTGGALFTGATSPHVMYDKGGAMFKDAASGRAPILVCCY